MDATLKIFEHLELKGIDVNFPNTHKGVVENPMVVILDMGQYPQYGNRVAGKTLIHLILHVPQDAYPDILALNRQVKEQMKCLKGIVRATGNETPTINDDVKKSYTSSIEYEVLKRL